MKLSELIKEVISKFNNLNCNRFCFVIYTISRVIVGEFIDNKLVNVTDENIDSTSILDYYLFNNEFQINKNNKLLKHSEYIIDPKHKEIDKDLKNGFGYLEKCVIDNKLNTPYKFLELCNNFKYNSDGILYVESTTFYDLKIKGEESNE